MALFKPGSIQPDNVTDRGKVERVKLSGPGDTTETTEWIDVATQAELDTHAAAADPHPGYLTPAEGNAAYQPLDTDLTAIAALVSAADKFAYATGAGTWAIADLTAAGRALLDDAAAVNQRTTLGLVIGTDVQAFDADLTALAAISGVQGDIIYHNGTSWVKLLAGTSGQFLRTAGVAANPTWATVGGGGDLLAANNLSDVALASTARTNLGLAIGTNVQAFDAELAALAGLTSAADALPYFTGAGTAAVTTVTAAARTVLDDATTGAMLTTLGGQPLDTDLTAIAALTSAADKLPYATGAGTWALADLTAAGRALIDDASNTVQRTTLGLGNAAEATIGTAAGNVIGVNTVDAKGDLLVGTAADTITRLAVGTNTQVLTADSAEASGVKWAAAGSGSVAGGADHLALISLGVS